MPWSLISPWASFSALASLIFFIFPTTRNGIGYGYGDATKAKTVKLTTDDKKKDSAMDAAGDDKNKKSSGPSSSDGRQNPNAHE